MGWITGFTILNKVAREELTKIISEQRPEGGDQGPKQIMRECSRKSTKALKQKHAPGNSKQCGSTYSFSTSVIAKPIYFKILH